VHLPPPFILKANRFAFRLIGTGFMTSLFRWTAASIVFGAAGIAVLQTGVLDGHVQGLDEKGERAKTYVTEALHDLNAVRKSGITYAEGKLNGAEPTLKQTQINYRIAAVEERAIIESVEATGTLTPVALVSVSSQVSGQILMIHADFNDEVQRGDVIAVIDPLSFEIAVEQAEAEVGVAHANVLKARVSLRDAEGDLEGKIALAAGGAGSKIDRRKAAASRDLAAAQLDDATHGLRRTEASLKQAKADLARTVVRSPVDGSVIQRNIEVGQTVAVSLQAPILYTIAQDLREMQVNTSIPESEIGRIRTGQRLEFTADSFPGRIFHGTVVQIRKQPQISQNVVTYTVVATAPNPDALLLPGMTATARIIIDENERKLAVPTAALRFRPPSESRSTVNRVFVEREGQAVAVPVTLGVTDGAYTAVAGADLKAGDTVIIGLGGDTYKTSKIDTRRSRDSF
jgi:HlyD family secretion protein